MERQYARFEIEFLLGGVRRKLESLVSEFGARRVYDMNSMPKNVPMLTGQQVDLNIRGLKLQGVFNKEILPEASFYNIRFVYDNAAVQDEMRKRIGEMGFSPPWKRMYPRIPSLQDTVGSPLPTVALVDNPDSVDFYKVVNFTLGGLLLEAEADTAFMALGSRFYFQLMISSGNSISGIWGRVVRIDEDMRDGRVVRRFGVQIVSMSTGASKHYKQLIVAYCERVREIYGY